MGVMFWIVFGIVAGIAAKYVMPGPSAGGMAMGIVIGIGGAVVGGIIGTALPGGTTSGFDVRSMLLASAGSLLLLLFYRSYALKTGLQTLP